MANLQQPAGQAQTVSPARTGRPCVWLATRVVLGRWRRRGRKGRGGWEKRKRDERESRMK